MEAVRKILCTTGRRHLDRPPAVVRFVPDLTFDGDPPPF